MCFSLAEELNHSEPRIKSDDEKSTPRCSLKRGLTILKTDIFHTSILLYYYILKRMLRTTVYFKF